MTVSKRSYRRHPGRLCQAQRRRLAAARPIGQDKRVPHSERERTGVMPSPGQMRAAGLLLLAVLCGAALVGCRRGGGADAELAAGPVLFEDVTEKLGITFVHDAEAVSDYRMPRVMGP